MLGANTDTAERRGTRTPLAQLALSLVKVVDVLLEALLKAFLSVTGSHHYRNEVSQVQDMGIAYEAVHRGSDHPVGRMIKGDFTARGFIEQSVTQPKHVLAEAINDKVWVNPE